MKKQNVLATTSKLMFMLFIVIALSFSSYAQQSENNLPKEIKVKTIDSENGITTTTEKTYEIGDDTDIDALLKELGINIDFGKISKDEVVEISVIRKKDNGNHHQSIKIDPLNEDDFVFTPPMDSKAFLGVFVEYLSLEQAQQMGLTYHDGAYVTEVIDGTGADNAGFQAGDLITAVDGKAVNNHWELIDIVRAHKAGEKVKIDFYRNGVSQQAEATLGGKEFMRDMMWNFNDEDLAPLKNICPLPCDPKEWDSFEMDFGAWWNENGDQLNTDMEKLQRELEEAMKELKDHLDGLSTENQDLNSVQEKLQKLYDDLGQEFETKKFTVIIKMEEVTPEDAKLNPNIKTDNSLNVDELTFSPNPNEGIFNLNFSLASNNHIMIRIFDAAGKEVYTEAVKNFYGSYRNKIDISTEPKGTYILQIEQSGKAFTKKVVVQ